MQASLRDMLVLRQEKRVAAAAMQAQQESLGWEAPPDLSSALSQRKQHDGGFADEAEVRGARAVFDMFRQSRPGETKEVIDRKQL